MTARAAVRCSIRTSGGSRAQGIEVFRRDPRRDASVDRLHLCEHDLRKGLGVFPSASTPQASRNARCPVSILPCVDHLDAEAFDGAASLVFRYLTLRYIRRMSLMVAFGSMFHNKNRWKYNITSSHVSFVYVAGFGVAVTAFCAPRPADLLPHGPGRLRKRPKGVPTQRSLCSASSSRVCRGWEYLGLGLVLLALYLQAGRPGERMAPQRKRRYAVLRKAERTKDKGYARDFSSGDIDASETRGTPGLFTDEMERRRLIERRMREAAAGGDTGRSAPPTSNTSNSSR
jgi:hypothetical protein